MNNMLPPTNINIALKQFYMWSVEMATLKRTYEFSFEAYLQLQFICISFCDVQHGDSVPKLVLLK